MREAELLEGKKKAKLPACWRGCAVRAAYLEKLGVGAPKRVSMASASVEAMLQVNFESSWGGSMQNLRREQKGKQEGKGGKSET